VSTNSEQDHLIEEENDAELLAASGLYRKLHDMQYMNSPLKIIPQIVVENS